MENEDRLLRVYIYTHTHMILIQPFLVTKVKFPYKQALPINLY